MRFLTQLAAVAFLFLGAQESFQALQVVYVVLLPPGGVEDGGRGAVAGPQVGALSGAQAAGVGGRA